MERRSQASALSHATESTGVHGSISRLGQLQAEHRVGQGQLAGRAVREVGVDALGVGLEVGDGVLVEDLQLGLGRPAPAERADDDVGLQGGLVGADELAQPARGDVAPQVHLEEPVLGVHVSLGPEQVLGGVGVDVGHPLGVPQHLDVRGQAGDVDLAVPVGQGPTDRDRDQRHRHDEPHDDQQRDPDRTPAQDRPPRHDRRLGQADRQEDRPG